MWTRRVPGAPAVETPVRRSVAGSLVALAAAVTDRTGRWWSVSGSRGRCSCQHRRDDLRPDRLPVGPGMAVARHDGLGDRDTLGRQCSRHGVSLGHRLDLSGRVVDVPGLTSQRTTYECGW